MSTYTIYNVDRNTWHPDGSPVLNDTLLETTRIADVIKWWRDSQDTTALIGATLYVDKERWGEHGAYSLQSLMAHAKHIGNGNITLDSIQQANQS